MVQPTLKEVANNLFADPAIAHPLPKNPLLIGCAYEIRDVDQQILGRSVLVKSGRPTGESLNFDRSMDFPVRARG